MNWEKLPAGTELQYAHQFYTVSNVRGGYAWEPITPATPTCFVLPPSDLVTSVQRTPAHRTRTNGSRRKTDGEGRSQSPPKEAETVMKDRK